MMFGYACRETDELMPLPIAMAHRFAKRLADVRKAGVLPYLRPDGKSQVTIAYEGTVAKRVDTVLISAQHREEVDVETLLAPDVRAEVIDPVLREFELDAEGVRILVNPTGRFEIGGPKADTGLTGRKIIVDSYGGMAPHGGGCFSGKDPTKVDRSAAYMARYVAKNLVAAGAAERLQIQVAYAIGTAHPVSLAVDTFGTEHVDPDRLVDRRVGRVRLPPRRDHPRTWICVARSTRTRPPTATSVARSSPGRRPTARMSSAAPSRSATPPPVPSSPREAPTQVLSGPVSVCIDRPLLALDRPFTYDLPRELGAGVGSAGPGPVPRPRDARVGARHHRGRTRTDPRRPQARLGGAVLRRALARPVPRDERAVRRAARRPSSAARSRRGSRRRSSSGGARSRGRAIGRRRVRHPSPAIGRGGACSTRCARVRARSSFGRRLRTRRASPSPASGRRSRPGARPS